MHSYPSRSECIYERLYMAAERGQYILEEQILYPGEIKHLRKKGFVVITTESFYNYKNLYYCTIDWSHPFPDGMPHLVYSYINHSIESYPDIYIHNFAQKLFVIARKANR